MAFDDATPQTEATLFLQVNQAVASDPPRVSEILELLTTRVQPAPQCRYLNPPTLLQMVLRFACPATPAGQLVRAAHAVVNATGSAPPTLEALESAAAKLAELNLPPVCPEPAAVAVADALAASLAEHARALRWAETPDDPFLPFAKAVALSVARVDPSLREIPTLRPPRASAAYENWVSSELRPYRIYYDNYASTKKGFSAVGFLSLDSWPDKFSHLVEPLQAQPSHNDSLRPARYLAEVILPVSRGYGSDLRPLSDWMLEHNQGGCAANFELWHAVFDSLVAASSTHDSQDVSGLPLFEFYSYLTRQFVAAVFYYAFYHECGSSAKQSFHIHEQIYSTAKLLSDNHPPSEALSVDTSHIPPCETLKEFIQSDQNPAAGVLNAPLNEAIAYLLSTIKACLALGNLQKMPIQTYLELKNQKLQDNSLLQKHVLQAMTAIEPSDYATLMNYIQEFKNAFCVDAELEKDIDKVIFERLLQIDQFENATRYLQELPEHRASGSQAAFHITCRKFWDLLMNASNLDERIGKLKLATQCVAIMEKMCAQADADEAMKATVVRIKHLFKAFSNIKNFKLVLVRNQPVTPKSILEKLSQEASESACPPMSLISLILEQNPKSYLAYEKLFKTVNDFSIYCEVDSANVNSVKVQSICVESALIDGNFDFAYKHATDLLHHCVDRGYTQHLGDTWLMFYQVGKFIQPEWFNDYDEGVQDKKLAILKKQRTILSLAIKHVVPSAGTVDNSRLLVAQFKHINQELKKWYDDAEQHRSVGEQRAMQTTNQLHENISGLLNDAAISKNHASEKISNLFVSGLGWAIGAKRN